VSGERKADRVADDLLQRVVTGELAVGSLLPKEEELAVHYAVNRSVIREAIKLLEVHRLVRPVRRRGTEVLDPMASMSPEVLRAMLVPRAGRVDRAVLEDLLELRAGLDMQMSALAAERRTEEDIAALDAVLAKMGASLRDRQRYDAAALELSRTIARASHNRIFEMMVWWQQTVIVELDDVFRVVRPVNEPHMQGVTALVDQIKRGNVDAVRTLVAAFHAWATPRVLAAAALSSGEPLTREMEGIR
jgi:GntR family transcriptional repressor for pyruvate dehydrogenase complex